jgi:chemotaxis protein methyltransferase CheR
MAFTFFFRDTQILELAVKRVVPSVMGRSKVKIWDAGCAMGPEPYSLAIMCAENMGHFAFRNLSIHATDIDETGTFEAIIKNGVYPLEELRRLPEGIFDKYFRPNGKPDYFQIADTIRERVIFQKHNLLSLQPVGNDFSLVLCKNVLLHFQPDERIEVIKTFHKSLSPGGYLATEQTQKMPKEVEHLFEQVASDGQIFRKVEQVAG